MLPLLLNPEISVEPNLAFVQILILVAIQVGLFLLQELLRPKPDFEDARPAGLGDFQAPTATEDRVVPVVWGTARLKGPNVTWYGDLRIQEITEKVKTGTFSSTRVVVGHVYFVGMEFGLCHGEIDEIIEIEVADKVVFSGSVSAGDAGTNISINEPSHFGGREKGGRLVGTLRFYSGTPDQQQNAYMQGVLGTDIPAHVDICHAVWQQGEIGETPQIRPWAFTVSRFPNNLGLTPGNNIIRTRDANPAEAIYEAMTNPVFGLDVDPAQFDLATWQAAGNQLADEENGFSFALDSRSSITDFITEVLRQIDAVLYQDDDGRFVLRLIRDDYTLGSTLIVDESNVIELEQFARGGWTETQNDVRVRFVDRTDDFKGTSAIMQDMANVRIQDDQVVSAQAYPGVKHPELAVSLAARELRQLSFPLAKVRLAVNREAHGVRPGDVVRWSWSRLGITEMPLRVLRVDTGELVDGRVVLHCIQDVFRPGEVLFSAPQPTGWVVPANDAIAIVDEVVEDCPYWFILVDELLQGVAGERLISMAARPNTVAVGFRQFVDTGGGAGYEETAVSTGMCPTATLVNDYSRHTAGVETSDLLVVDNAVDFDRLEDVTPEDISQFGLNMALIERTSTSHEIIAFEELVDAGGGQWILRNVHRGMLDTLPEDHSSGARIYFFREFYATSDVSFGPTASLNVRHLTETTRDLLALGSASILPITLSRRAERPLPPGNFSAEGTYLENGTVADGDVLFEWAHRNRLDPAALDQEDGDSALGQDTDVEYELTLFERPGLTQIRQVVLDSSSPPPTNGTWTSYDYTRAQQATDNGGVAPHGLRAEIVSRFNSSGLESRKIGRMDFEVFSPHTNSVDLDGSTEYMRSGSQAAIGIATVWSIAIWVKRSDADTNFRTLCEITPDAADTNRIRIVRGNTGGQDLRVLVADSAGTTQKNYEYLGALSAAGSWDLVVVTLDGAAGGDPLRTYVNGSEVIDASPDVNNTLTMTDGSRRIYVGVGRTLINLWQGRVHSMAVWDTVLTPAEVTAIYNGGNGSDFNLGLNSGDYASAATLQHWHRLGFKVAPGIGDEYAPEASPAHDLDGGASGVTDVDIVADAP